MMTHDPIPNIPPESARAVADYHMIQARTLYARYGLARRAAESKREIRAAGRKARERLDSLFKEVERRIGELQRDAAKGHAGNVRQLPAWSRAAKERRAEITRQAVERAADQYEMTPAVAMSLYRVQKRRAAQREKLERDRQILHLYSLGKSDAEIAGVVGLHPKVTGAAIRGALGKSDSNDRSAGAAERAVAAIDRKLADLEPKDVPESLVPPPAVFDGRDAAASDEPIVAACRRWWEAWEEHGNGEVQLGQAFPGTWETDPSPAAVAARRRLDELEAEADRLLDLIMTMPSVSPCGLYAKLGFLSTMLQDCSFWGLPVELLQAIVGEASHLAATAPPS